MQILSPSDVLRIGLELLQLTFRANTSLAYKTSEFSKHYGSNPSSLATMWYNLNVRGHLASEEEKGNSGFRKFMVAHNYLWTYPKNSSVLSQRFHFLCKRYCRGKPLWDWIGKIEALKVSAIVWDPSLDDPDSNVFVVSVVSVDGTDWKVNEKKHARLNQDKKMCSHKFKSAGLKYEIELSIFTSDCVWIAGPFRGKKATSQFTMVSRTKMMSICV